MAITIMDARFGDKMNLKKCPKCGEIVDVDLMEPEVPPGVLLDMEKIIGCGLAQSDLMLCKDCPQEEFPEECKIVREQNKLTYTRLKDYKEGKL